jgi:hypothetical protein
VQEVAVQQPAGPGPESEHWHGGVNFNIEHFNVEECLDILEMLQDEPELEPEPSMTADSSSYREVRCWPPKPEPSEICSAQ